MITPAIHFPGKCAEAIELYKKAFDVTVNSISYYRDAPPNSGMPDTADIQNLVMHSDLTICGTRVNMADYTKEVTVGDMIMLNVFLDSAEDVRKAYHVLLDGGTVETELGPQFWSELYGSVIDRFGVRWQLMVE